MDLSEGEIFENVHGINSNRLESVKSELETRRISHKYLLRELDTDTESTDMRVQKIINYKSNAKAILQKYKKYMID